MCKYDKIKSKHPAYTYEKIAKMIGLPKSTLHKWIQLRNDFDGKKIIKIFKIVKNKLKFSNIFNNYYCSPQLIYIFF